VLQGVGFIQNLFPIGVVCTHGVVRLPALLLEVVVTESLHTQLQGVHTTNVSKTGVEQANAMAVRED
jgi:hypothetical protein